MEVGTLTSPHFSMRKFNGRLKAEGVVDVKMRKNNMRNFKSCHFSLVKVGSIGTSPFVLFQVESKEQ